MQKIVKLAAPERGLFVSGSSVFARPICMTKTKDTLSDPVKGINLHGGPYHFDKLELLIKTDENISVFSSEIDEAREWALAEGCIEKLDQIILNLTGRHSSNVFTSLSSPLLMGVVNVTPDSFYDGGKNSKAQMAISQAHRLIADGVDIIDIGGESSKPGAVPVTAEQEIERVIPVIKEVSGFGVPISIDTQKSSVMEAAVIAGASIVNDISALSADPKSLRLLRELGVPVILMHMQGTPVDMQNNPYYQFAPLDILEYLRNRIDVCLESGISLSNIIVDPGIGFGKNLNHNVALLNRLSLFHSLRVPIAIGVSRKSFIASLNEDEPPDQRLAGSLAMAIWACQQGVQILRVHDVAETKQALKIYKAVVDDDL